MMKAARQEINLKHIQKLDNDLQQQQKRSGQISKRYKRKPSFG